MPDTITLIHPVLSSDVKKKRLTFSLQIFAKYIYSGGSESVKIKISKFLEAMKFKNGLQF